MEFHEKLRSIRKEQGISQEELAARLEVSRQAVSKWESGQGFPEIEKLIQLSSMFNVSLDYLLKSSSADDEQREDSGYYASREAVEGFLLHRRTMAFRIAAGIAVMIMSISLAMATTHVSGRAAMLVVAAIGACVLIMHAFMPKRYREIETKPLIFDESFITKFREAQIRRRWHCGIMIAGGIMMIILSFVMLMFFENLPGLSGKKLDALAPILWAVAVFLIVFASSVMQAEGIIANNAAHMREVEKDRRSEPLLEAVLPLTAIIYVGIGLIWGAWHPGWIIFPIATLICIAIAELRAHKGKQ